MACLACELKAVGLFQDGPNGADEREHLWLARLTGPHLAAIGLFRRERNFEDVARAIRSYFPPGTRFYGFDRIPDRDAYWFCVSHESFPKSHVSEGGEIPEIEVMRSGAGYELNFRPLGSGKPCVRCGAPRDYQLDGKLHDRCYECSFGKVTEPARNVWDHGAMQDGVTDDLPAVAEAAGCEVRRDRCDECLVYGAHTLTCSRNWFNRNEPPPADPITGFRGTPGTTPTSIMRGGDGPECVCGAATARTPHAHYCPRRPA